MCSNVRVLTAAIAGFVIGDLSGSAIAAWVLMAVAGAAMFLWSRASDRRNGTSCAVPRTRLARRPAPQATAASIVTLGRGSAADERAVTGGER